jgi:hypothetical protein
MKTTSASGRVNDTVHHVNIQLTAMMNSRAQDNTELFGDLSDRTRRLDHRFHGLFPELRRELSATL